MLDSVGKNCANSLLASVNTFGIDYISKVKPVKNKPIMYFSDDNGTYGILSQYSTRFSNLDTRTITPVDAGYHTFAVAAANMLSSGTFAQHAFFSLGVPNSHYDDFILHAQEGISIASSLSGINLIGGDIFESDIPSIDILLYGSVPKKTHLVKKSIKDGFFIYISGHPGDTFAGNMLHNEERSHVHYERVLVNRYLKPGMYGASIHKIMDELKPAYISVCNKSIIDTLFSIIPGPINGFMINYHSFPLSHEFIQYNGNNHLEAFKTALTKPGSNELLIITNKSVSTSEYIDDAYISLIGKITKSGHYIETHNSTVPFNPRKEESYSV